MADTEGEIFDFSALMESPDGSGIFNRRVRSAFVSQPLDRALEVLKAHGYDPISAEEDAWARFYAIRFHEQDPGVSVGHTREAHFTKEAFLYRPKHWALLLRRSPMIECAGEAVIAHAAGAEFFPTEEQLGRCMEGAMEIYNDGPVLNIPVERLQEDRMAVWAFGKQARMVGMLMSHYNLGIMPIDILPRGYVDGCKGPFVRQLWVGDIRRSYSAAPRHASGYAISGSMRLDQKALRGIKYADMQA